jgi:hypothetical protein
MEWVQESVVLACCNWTISTSALDYPPFFAYFEKLLSIPASFIDPNIVDLNNLGYDSWPVIVYQRTTVILTELVLGAALLRYFQFDILIESFNGICSSDKQIYPRLCGSLNSTHNLSFPLPSPWTSYCRPHPLSIQWVHVWNSPMVNLDGSKRELLMNHRYRLGTMTYILGA